MAASLADPYAKHARGNKRLGDLRCELQTFRERNPYTVTDEVRADGVHVGRLSVREYPPPELGLLFGEILFNWRSALDNLAYQLILLGGRRVPKEGEFTGFPLFKKRKDFEGTGRERIKGVRDEHAKIIESLQPYPERQKPVIRALDVINTYHKHR